MDMDIVMQYLDYYLVNTHPYFPDEIWYLIFLDCSLKDLLQIHLVCRRFREIVQELLRKVHFKKVDYALRSIEEVFEKKMLELARCWSCELASDLELKYKLFYQEVILTLPLSVFELGNDKTLLLWYFSHNEYRLGKATTNALDLFIQECPPQTTIRRLWKRLRKEDCAEKEKEVYWSEVASLILKGANGRHKSWRTLISTLFKHEEGWNTLARLTLLNIFSQFHSKDKTSDPVLGVGTKCAIEVESSKWLNATVLEIQALEHRTFRQKILDHEAGIVPYNNEPLPSPEALIATVNKLQILQRLLEQLNKVKVITQKPQLDIAPHILLAEHLKETSTLFKKLSGKFERLHTEMEPTLLRPTKRQRVAT